MSFVTSHDARDGLGTGKELNRDLQYQLLLAPVGDFCCDIPDLNLQPLIF